VQLRLHDARQPRGVHVALAEPQHLRRQRIHLAFAADEAEVFEGDQVAPRGSAGQAAQRGHFAHRQARAVLVEGGDDRQALFEAGDQVALLRACRHGRRLDGNRLGGYRAGSAIVLGNVSVLVGSVQGVHVMWVAL
jgi:hypothetical protein